MAELSFEAGNPVFLNIHLGSGLAGKFVQAVIKNAAGAVLATVDLVDEASGSYFNNTDYLMPNLPFIQVTYKVYDDAGHTTLSADDQDGSVIFALKEVLDAIQRLDEIFVTVEDGGDAVVTAGAEESVQVTASENSEATVTIASDDLSVFADPGESATIVAKETCP